MPDPDGIRGGGNGVIHRGSESLGSEEAGRGTDEIVDGHGRLLARAKVFSSVGTDYQNTVRNGVPNTEGDINRAIEEEQRSRVLLQAIYA